MPSRPAPDRAIRERRPRPDRPENAAQREIDFVDFGARLVHHRALLELHSVAAAHDTLALRRREQSEQPVLTDDANRVHATAQTSMGGITYTRKPNCTGQSEKHAESPITAS